MKNIFVKYSANSEKKLQRTEVKSLITIPEG